MKIKQILSVIAVVLLPMVANAGYTYNYVLSPRIVQDNGVVVKTAAHPPYATVTINDDDDEHIASTAYVKGAYNDTIAGVNKMQDDINGKQNILYNNDNAYIRSEVVSSYDLEDGGVEGYEEDGADQFLISLDGAMWLMNQTKSEVNSMISDKRVEIYTNWDDDDETTEVPLVTATGQ